MVQRQVDKVDKSVNVNRGLEDQYYIKEKDTKKKKGAIYRIDEKNFVHQQVLFKIGK